MHNEIAELRDNIRLTKAEFRQEKMSLQEMAKHEICDHSISMSQQISSGKNEGLATSISSPLNRSQFL